MQNQQSTDRIMFTDLADRLAELGQNASKSLDNLILQANFFSHMLQLTLNLVKEQQKISQEISNFHFINSLAQELFENIEKELKDLHPPTDKSTFEAQFNYLKTHEMKTLETVFDEAKRIKTPDERRKLFERNGIKMLNESYAEFFSPVQLGRLVNSFCVSFKSEGFNSVSFDIQCPPLSSSESERLKSNMGTIHEYKQKYLMAIFENAAKCGYPPSQVKIKLDGQDYFHNDDAFKHYIQGWEKTAKDCNAQLVQNVKDHYQGHGGPRL